MIRLARRLFECLAQTHHLCPSTTHLITYHLCLNAACKHSVFHPISTIIAFSLRISYAIPGVRWAATLLMCSSPRVGSECSGSSPVLRHPTFDDVHLSASQSFIAYSQRLNYLESILRALRSLKFSRWLNFCFGLPCGLSDQCSLFGLSTACY